MPPSPAAGAEPETPPVPRAVWVLGGVSLLMDVSSEMIHSLLPLFMVTVLGTSAAAVGAVEGFAEATASVLKVFSGAWSDYIGRRKGMALAGYSLAAATKPLFALAQGLGLVFTARILDRVGKGIRGAPRDALIADVTPPRVRGAAFGVRQSLDTTGAFMGPLIALALMYAWNDDFRAVFAVSIAPAVLAVALLAFGIREPASRSQAQRRNPIRLDNLRRLDATYWWVVAVGAVFSLARFSEAFLVLRAQQLGVPIAFVPGVMVAMNVVYSSTAYPFGRLSDRVSHVGLLACGLSVLVLADLVLAEWESLSGLFLGVALWGVHMGMTQGLLSTMVSHTCPADLRGTGFGCFNLVSGLALLPASVIAGWLWDAFGAAATFQVGATVGLAALGVLAAATRQRARRKLLE